MKVKQTVIRESSISKVDWTALKEINPNLVLAFGHPKYFSDLSLGKDLKAIFPDAQLLGCSSAGEISNDGVEDDSLVVTATCFDNTTFKIAEATVAGSDESYDAGKKLSQGIADDKLRAVFVLSPGLDINGSALTRGLYEDLSSDVTVTGGMAGDAGNFETTYTMLNGNVSSKTVVAMGICGDGFNISCGSEGGWQPFGPERRVTKAENNILYELDGKPALALYKEYLGDKAADLPASGLLYPFALIADDHQPTGVIRTILGIDEEAGSLILAGEMPENHLVRLMHANMTDLVDGALKAANTSLEESPKTSQNDLKSLGILISCVGRKIVMGDDTEEEIDAVREAYGDEIILTGFYSYGEICHAIQSKAPALHNQTMTITRFEDV